MWKKDRDMVGWPMMKKERTRREGEPMMDEKSSKPGRVDDQRMKDRIGLEYGSMEEGVDPE